MEEKTALKKSNITTPIGSITIAEEVVANIAGLAAMEVEGISAISVGLGSGLLELIRKKDFSKGVKVELVENEVVVEVNVAVNYRYEIPRVATEVQEKVKRAVESRTGLVVKAVNVNVAAVTIEKEEPAPEESPSS